MPTSSELDIHVGWLPENFTKVNDVSNGTYTFDTSFTLEIGRASCRERV